MTLVGLISDVHAAPKPVEEALTLFSDKGVDLILCAGDIAGYMNQLECTVKLLMDSECRTVVGNHDLSYLKRNRNNNDIDSVKYLRQLPATFKMKIEGKRLYMVHAQPPDACHGGIKLLNKQGGVQLESLEYWSEILKPFDYDVLVLGHTHQVFAEFIGGTLVINPGSSVFNHCCAILRLPEMRVEMFALSGKKIEKTWNWGEHMIYGKQNKKNK